MYSIVKIFAEFLWKNKIFQMTILELGIYFSLITFLLYRIAVVADYFCATQQKIEELYNLTPIIKNLRAEADYLNAFFIDAEGKEN